MIARMCALVEPAVGQHLLSGLTHYGLLTVLMDRLPIYSYGICNAWMEAVLELLQVALELQPLLRLAVPPKIMCITRNVTVAVLGLQQL
jgi:hypothetical protein